MNANALKETAFSNGLKYWPLILFIGGLVWNASEANSRLATLEKQNATDRQQVQKIIDTQQQILQEIVALKKDLLYAQRERS